MSTRDEIEAMLDDLEQRESKLSDWERKFVASIEEQLRRSGALTETQDEKLTEIWEKAT